MALAPRGKTARLTLSLVAALAALSCGPDGGEEPEDGYPVGYVLDVCRCRYRPAPEPPVRPWSECETAFKQVFTCEPGLFWCPYQPWGWMCAADDTP